MTSSIARNSAPSSTKRPAAEKKAAIRNSTECTGLRAETTASALTSITAESSIEGDRLQVHVGVATPSRPVDEGRRGLPA